MNRWEELTRHQAQDDAGGEVVLVDAVAELEVLIEHGPQGERNGLYSNLISVTLHLKAAMAKKNPHFEYYVGCFRGIVWVVRR